MEWLSVKTALENAGESRCYFHHIISQQLDECYKYYLQKHRDSLVAAYVKWEAKIRHIPYAWVPSRPWGPIAEDIAGCLSTTYNSSMVAAAEYSTDQPMEKGYDSNWEDVILESDDDLLMAIEEMALAEEYPIGQEDEGVMSEDEEWLEGIGNGYLPSSPVQLPLKRCRLQNLYIYLECLYCKT